MNLITNQTQCEYIKAVNFTIEFTFLQNKNKEMYSAHNEGKLVAAERFIRTLKNKKYKYMTSISKNVYINKLYDIVNKYNNTL